MPDSNNGEKKILSLGEMAELRRKVSREELDRDLTELSFAILSRQEIAETNISRLAEVVKQQNVVILSLEGRSLAGRIRRAKARLAAWWAWACCLAHDLGEHIDPPTVKP